MPQDPVKSKKRRREQYNIDVKLVEIYEDLANEQDEIKLKAAQELISRLTPENNPTEEQIRKTLQRLFRGLCSGRKAARIGFSIALTEILSQVFSPDRKYPLSELTIPKALDVWQSQTDAAGSDSKQVSAHKARPYSHCCLILASGDKRSSLRSTLWS
jgi:DNA polymerase phi